MFGRASIFTRQSNSHLSRRLHATCPTCQLLQKSPPTNALPRQDRPKDRESEDYTKQAKDGEKSLRHVKRNELGVQLLSRQLHSQIFKNVSFPTPDQTYVQISREHLEMHGLDPAQGSVLPDVGFILPELQGANLPEHFHRIGSHVAEPWITLAKSFATQTLPPKPDDWFIQRGWTKYYYHKDGSSFSEHVPYPMHNGKPEEMLTFDVETMPHVHPYAVIAIAASPNGWYSWVSPWLLGETDEPKQLIPLGDPSVPRVVVGHNVSYDRARLLEEYTLLPTKTRFLDTMALHVAVKGISSHQRPAWLKYRKSKQAEQEQHEEAVEVVEWIKSAKEQCQTEGAVVAPDEEKEDSVKREELRRLHRMVEEILPNLEDGSDSDVAESELSSKRWEDLTSANSLADVARLHCGITMDKGIRTDFMNLTPAEIRGNLADYLEYCAEDVDVTHKVYTTVLLDFLASCPHPVSFAGILTMGSSFLTVNQDWELYLQQAESVYREMEEGVKNKLKVLAEDAKLLMDQPDRWKEDIWLSQLDWTPKVASKSRGVHQIVEAVEPENSEIQRLDSNDSIEPLPRWYTELSQDPFEKKNLEQTLPLVLKLAFNGHPMQFNPKERWHFEVDGKPQRLSTSKNGRKTTVILSLCHAGVLLQQGGMTSCNHELALAISRGNRTDAIRAEVLALAKSTLNGADADQKDDPWLRQLNWSSGSPTGKPPKPKLVKSPPVLWPKWYWDLSKPKQGSAPGTLDITVRNRIAPLLLRLSWLGRPLFHSREHGWIFRVPSRDNFVTRSTPLSFSLPVDATLAEASLCSGYIFYKLPHKDGEKANVGSPLGKTFIKYAQDGTLKSPGDEAKEALDMNAQCSYWISARDRILNQLVIWQSSSNHMGFEASSGAEKQRWGIILPQVITMGTVTRRAIEKTWLTASNAKKNRVGSELKSMVRAPDGYAIVGADVDSEELWISSCMGDAQFGLHGATAIGWMTLEGTKAAGTDLHSKTASILGISRDQAKIFNYSRIYGAGMRHAVLLLLQSNAGMLPEEAQKLAENLYASTKGKNTHRADIFDRKFWFGGTESFVFNKLEEIALSDRPQTPALGCRVTYALSKEYLPAEFGSDYMTSRINWVVQSSGVDYLHLLIASMDYLIAKFDIKARYLISVHDELRYLVKENDKYRAALALQVANIWTRSLFAYKLGMDDLPQGVAFFSAVDIDNVLRKEVDLPCVTPSQPFPIPPGESLDITGILAKTSGGSMWKDGRSMTNGSEEFVGNLDGYVEPNCLAHRATSTYFLRAQATDDFGEVKGLARKASGKKYTGGMGNNKSRTKKSQPASVDWPDGEALVGSYFTL